MFAACASWITTLLVVTHALAFFAGIGLYAIVRGVRCGEAP